MIVNPNETVRVIARFSDYTGRYAFHCHNLEQEDDMRMAQFEGGWKRGPLRPAATP